MAERVKRVLTLVVKYRNNQISEKVLSTLSEYEKGKCFFNMMHFYHLELSGHPWTISFPNDLLS